MAKTSLCLAVLSLIGCTATDRVDERRCTELRDHVIDARLQAANGVDVAAHRAALQQALGDDFVARCRTALAPAELGCMLAAADATAIEACARPVITERR